VKTNIFQDNLEDGEVGENALKRGLNKILFTESVKLIKWDKKDIFSMNLQRGGVDGISKTREIKWDSKIRRYGCYRYGDILLEEESVMETKKPGWFYYSISDFIIYVWRDKFGNGLIDGYFIFLQNQLLKTWFEKNKEKYPKKIAESIDNKTGKVWHTLNRAVPIKEFPEGTLLNFKPNISLIKQQLDLLPFLDYSASNQKTFIQGKLFDGRSP